MVWVVDVSGVDEYLPVYPLMHFVGRNESGVWLPVIGANEVNRWIWPAFSWHRLPPLLLSYNKKSNLISCSYYLVKPAMHHVA